MKPERIVDNITIIALLAYSHQTAADENMRLVFLVLTIARSLSFAVACFCAIMEKYYSEDD